MLNFNSNFFFIKFSILFFIVTVFGYWGIDLNSEEVYIAFSFFFLVILAFVLSRRAILFFFAKTLNTKYSRILLDLLIIVGALNLKLVVLKNLSISLNSLIGCISRFLLLLVDFVKNEIYLFSNMNKAKLNFLTTVLFIELKLHINTLTKLNRFNVFGSSFSKFFNIDL